MNHLEFGDIAVGAPGSEARMKAERADTVRGLQSALKILEINIDREAPDSYWVNKAATLLMRAIKQLTA